MPLQEGWDRCPICGAKLDIYRISGNEYALRCFSCGYRNKGEYIADGTSATDRINIAADGNIEVEDFITEVKTEYAKGVLKGIDIVQDCFVKFAGDNPDKLNGTITVTDLIGFITIYRKEVEKDLVKLEKKVGEDGEV